MPQYLMLLPILIPIVGAALSLLIRFKTARARNGLILLCTLLSSISMWALVLFPPEGTMVLLNFTDSLDLSLRLDGAGRIFAGLSSALWPLALIYAFDS
jgi:formate hydrogenlyase subunit 3/multisubunit Na+/H+ antiporter MnhD subunit